MDLPKCPSCGDQLQAGSPQGPARCPECGFVTPLELDGAALEHLLDDASHRGLGPRSRLAPSGDAPEPRLEGKRTPQMLEATGPPDLPQLSPPVPPRELSMGAPPPIRDPKAPMGDDGRVPPAKALGGSLEERDEARKRELKARGELLR
jgi:hypothetical protein